MKCTTTNATKSTQCADEQFLGNFFSCLLGLHTHTSAYGQCVANVKNLNQSEVSLTFCQLTTRKYTNRKTFISNLNFKPETVLSGTI